MKPCESRNETMSIPVGKCEKLVGKLSVTPYESGGLDVIKSDFTRHKLPVPTVGTFSSQYGNFLKGVWWRKNDFCFF